MKGIVPPEKVLVRVLLPQRLDAGVEPPPRLMVLVRVELVRLVNIELPLGLCLLDKGRPRGRQTRRRAGAYCVNRDHDCLPPCRPGVLLLQSARLLTASNTR